MHLGALSVPLDEEVVVGCNPMYPGCRPMYLGCNPTYLGYNSRYLGCNPMCVGALPVPLDEEQRLLHPIRLRLVGGGHLDT